MEHKFPLPPVGLLCLHAMWQKHISDVSASTTIHAIQAVTLQMEAENSPKRWKTHLPHGVQTQTKSQIFSDHLKNLKTYAL